MERIKVFTQSSIRIESEQGMIYIDPLQIPDAPHDADYIFITHDHGDHFSTGDIEKIITPETVLVIPEKMREKAEKLQRRPDRLITVVPGEDYMVSGLAFRTVAAYNNIKPFHPKRSGWVGYILSVNEKRIYIAGDTDVTKETKEVQCDIAMVPIGGTFTMDAAKAAELINIISPEIAIPTHYGSIVGKMADADLFASKVKPPVQVEIKIGR